jgi:hypothetical protein
VFIGTLMHMQMHRMLNQRKNTKTKTILMIRLEFITLVSFFSASALLIKAKVNNSKNNFANQDCIDINYLKERIFPFFSEQNTQLLQKIRTLLN